MPTKAACHLAGAFLGGFALARHGTDTTEELVNSRTPLEDRFLVASRKQSVRSLGKRVLDPRLYRGASLILILLLSLGLWVAIWKLASAVMR
jgi:hypothetical protein